MATNTRPRGAKRWSKLSSRQQNRLKYRRSLWRSSHSKEYQKLATRIKSLRWRLKLSQVKMASMLHVSLRSYKRYEAAESYPSIACRTHIAGLEIGK